MFFVGLALIIFLFPNLVFGAETFKVKQKIEEPTHTLYWLHTDRYFGTEVLYSNSGRLWLGIGPNLAVVLGPVKVKISGCTALIADVSKRHWPVKQIEFDSFFIPAFEKWTCYVRTAVDVDIDREKDTVFWGQDYVGYQITDNWQIRARSEWKYRNGKLQQSLGFGWSRKLSSDFSFDGYLGCEVEKPNSKVGWLEMKVSFK